MSMAIRKIRITSVAKSIDRLLIKCEHEINRNTLPTAIELVQAIFGVIRRVLIRTEVGCGPEFKSKTE